MSNREIIDISPKISSRTAVFPGDVSFSEEFSLKMSSGANLTLSSIKTTVHIGAHADAPSHYAQDGKPIDERSLTPYLGPAQVIEVQIPKSRRIRPDDFSEIEIRAPRVLFKTGSFSEPDTWHDEFNSLSPDAVVVLAKKGVVLVGIDTPSIDPPQDAELLSHNAVYKHDLSILEGLILDHVDPGLYDLIALPLKIEGADASPVRAVLVR